MPHVINDGIRRSRTPTAYMEGGWKQMEKERERPRSVDPDKLMTKTLLGVLLVIYSAQIKWKSAQQSVTYACT